MRIIKTMAHEIMKKGGVTHATVKMDAKKLAKDEFTTCNDPASEVSMVSMSFPNRFNIRPWGVVSWNLNVARTTVTNNFLVVEKSKLA